MMGAAGYNPDFARAVNAKRALAEMRRHMREAEAEAKRLEQAARDAADAILAMAFEEARLIMARAYDAQARPRRPVAEIIGEVAREHGMPPQALRGRRTGTEAARRARHDAIRRVGHERQDLSAADIGRIFGMGDGRAVGRVLSDHG